MVGAKQSKHVSNLPTNCLSKKCWFLSISDSKIISNDWSPLNTCIDEGEERRCETKKEEEVLMIKEASKQIFNSV